jgi:hypothetical protein
MAIKDKAAFQRSVETLATWEFDRIIVGHGEVLETDGKRLLEKAVEPLAVGTPDFFARASSAECKLLLSVPNQF